MNYEYEEYYKEIKSIEGSKFDVLYVNEVGEPLFVMCMIDGDKMHYYGPYYEQTLIKDSYEFNNIETALNYFNLKYSM